LQRSPRFLAQGTLEQEKKLQKGPQQLSTVAGDSVRRFLAGGEGLGGEEPVLDDLQELLITMVGDVFVG
jgi:hypothetical protein